MHERDPSIHATLDPRAWPPILARYREPNCAQHNRTRDHGRKGISFTLFAMTDSLRSALRSE